MSHCALSVSTFSKITRSFNPGLFSIIQINLRPFRKRYSHLAKKVYPRENEIINSRIPTEFLLVPHCRVISTTNDNIYETACKETLESLTEFFEDLVEKHPALATSDVSYSDGVLTVNLGQKLGTYVINRQSPNKQIWLSSPISGPKRYDYVEEKQLWIYKHDGQTLHSLLEKELSKMLAKDINLTSYSCH